MSALRARRLFPSRAPAGTRDDSTVPPIPVKLQDGLDLSFAIIHENDESFSDLVINPRTRPGLRDAAKFDAILLVDLLEVAVDAQHCLSEQDELQER